MKSALYISMLCASLLVCNSCASRKPYYKYSKNNPSVMADTTSGTAITYSLFLAGGLSLDSQSPVMDTIREESKNIPAGLVLLGDILSIDDFSNSADENKALGLSSFPFVADLDKQFQDFILVPGEKEWHISKKSSSLAIRTLDDRLKDVKSKGRLILPSKGCGVPEVVRITKNTILVLVDSQWAIESASHPENKLQGCELSSLLEWRQALKDIFESHASDHIIVAAHHPVYANGPTAGNYPLISHLLPVPLVGTIITGIKSLTASNQHFGHPAYEAYRAAMITALEGCQNCVIVNGHEKSLQYYHQSDQHFLVAGSGSDVRHARKRERAEFSYMKTGFVRIDELISGELRLSFVATDTMSGNRQVWSKIVVEKNKDPKEAQEIIPDLSLSGQDSITGSASELYHEKKFLRGNFYRKAWSEQIKMPVVWLDSIYGGLKPVQLGGGNQTRSLRLENEAGEQYVIRSIDKKVTAVLPAALRGTFAENIVQDGIAASHPYGALVIPELAKAAGIFYSNPSIVYIPHQAALGIYDEVVGDGVYILEERPGGNTSSFINFGNTNKTISTSELIERIADSPDHLVDQRAVLRARLFDIWLGDWDRHDDQWRWAAFEENNHTIYRPIPRDRDQVFYNNDGILDYLASRPYFNPPLRRFEDKIDYLEGLIWAGKYFDRSFLHALTEEDFISVAQELRNLLSDEVIEFAFLHWPQQIDRLDGERIRNSLKIRREDLVQYATHFYKHLAQEVIIPGTNDKDIITIASPDDDHLMVSVDRITHNGVFPFYQRLFVVRETKEIRLFGLNKADSIRIEGQGKPNIRIRIVGGGGNDKLNNQNSNLKLTAYDDPDGMIVSGKPVRRHFNSKPLTNTFDRTDWHLNRHLHFPSPAYFTDEGFGLTYNFWLTEFGFRSDPFKSRHTAALSYYLNTKGFIGRYTGEYLNALGEYDAGLDAYITGPTFTQYYYGLGNTYVDYGEKIKYHIVKGSQLIFSPSISRRFGFGSRFTIRPSYQFIDLEDSHKDPRFVYSDAAHLQPEDFGHKNYASLTVAYNFERLDNAGFPSRGGDFSVSLGGRASLNGNSFRHGLLSTAGSLYIPFDNNGTLVLATHLQADKLMGSYEFFHALTLGGPDRLRGFRRDRFAGDARFIHATDLRIKLFKGRGLIPFSLGIYGSVDYGRVWYDEDPDSSDQWHTSLGGGIFIVPLGLTAFRLGIMIGKDDKQINIGGTLRF